MLFTLLMYDMPTIYISIITLFIRSLKPFQTLKNNYGTDLHIYISIRDIIEHFNRKYIFYLCFHNQLYHVLELNNINENISKSV